MDSYELALESETKKLKECQVAKGFVKIYKESEYSTCMDCEELIGCALRNSYVGVVYASMSKGAVGGFEF
jgi:hypothetical protein